jgi:hypothetical protein
MEELTMGRGNIKVSNPHERLFYVDNEYFEVHVLDTHRTVRDYEAEQEVFETFLENVAEEIMERTSMKSVCKYIGRDTKVILENNLFQIGITDNEWSIAFMILQKEDAVTAFQKSHIKKYENILRDVLFGYVPTLGIYTGPWTSGRIKREDYYAK